MDNQPGAAAKATALLLADLYDSSATLEDDRPMIEAAFEAYGKERERAALELACEAVERAREWARQYLEVGHKWEQATDYIRGMDKAEQYIRALLDAPPEQAR